jgi:hypothetical protein
MKSLTSLAASLAMLAFLTAALLAVFVILSPLAILFR